MGVSLDFLMTGQQSSGEKLEVQIPTALAGGKRNDLNRINWREFYRAVKKFL
jgi:hypothetical protein